MEYFYNVLFPLAAVTMKKKKNWKSIYNMRMSK